MLQGSVPLSASPLGLNSFQLRLLTLVLWVWSSRVVSACFSKQLKNLTHESDDVWDLGDSDRLGPIRHM